MQYIESNSKDVFLNLAMEEYVFKNFKDDSYLLLYKNDNAIVLGKYQNIYQEINVPEAEASGIKIARRISGGGTVFHDSGNLNYSFIADNEKNDLHCYDDFLSPIIKALQSMGVDARKRNVCDIAIGDLKISGNAQSIHENRILHHGTLLFDSDMEKLHRLLEVTDAIIESKAVPSVPSPVTNIREHLRDSSMTLDDFKSTLLSNIFPSGISRRKLTEDDMGQIEKLRDEKYNTWEWNWGKSPRFTLRRGDTILSVNHGIITSCHIPFASDEASGALLGKRYGYHNVLDILSPFFGDETKQIAKQLF